MSEKNGAGWTLLLASLGSFMAALQQDAGVAAGVNVALRELGAAFGVAVLAAVFASRGGYRTPAEFVHGFRPAMVVAGLVPLGGILAGLFARGRQPVGEPGRTLGDPAAVAEPAYLEQTL